MSDRYDIVSLKGKGRTGGVYEAVDTVLSRKVALRRFFSERGDTDIARWGDSFKNLAGHLPALAHPNLATVYDAGIDDDGAYMITEYCDHPTLETRLQSGRLELDEFWDFATNTLEALSIPHSQGFIHTGLSTKSIMLVPRSRGDIRYRIMDLGLAWLIPLINPDNPILSLSDPAIMAPELFDKKNPTPATDVYMIGMLFYQALAGGHPLAGLPFDEAHQKHLNHAFAPVTGYRTSVPPELSQWVEMLTHPNPAQRPQTATDALALLPLKSSINRAYFEPSTGSVGITSPTVASAPVAVSAPTRISGPVNIAPVQPAATPGYPQQKAPLKPLPKTIASAHASNNTPIIVTVVCLVVFFIILIAAVS